MASLVEEFQNFALVSVSCICTVYILFYLGWVAHKPKVVGAGRLKEQLLKHCPILSEFYWPTFWGFQCHLSTILRFALQKTPDIKYRRAILTLNDGGEVALDWGVPGNSSVHEEILERGDSPLLLIVPGITGCSMDNYVMHLVEDGLIEGYRPVVFNQRGNGGLKLKTLRTYSGSDISDLFEVVQYIHLKYPQASSIISIGVSLGGMILTQYLHQLGKECDINAVISVSAGWDPFVSRRSLEDKTVNKLLYSRLLVNNIKAIVESNIGHLNSEERQNLSLNLKGVMEAEVVSDIDRHLTVPLFGYSSLEDYYKACKNSDKLHKIKRPLICITAADDPFVPMESLPFEEIERNAKIVMVVTSYGGHFGFIEGFFPSNKTWMNRAVQQILATLKNNKT